MIAGNYTDVTRDTWTNVIGRSTRITWNANNKPTSITYYDSDGNALFVKQLTYDANGNCIEVKCLKP